jgi:MerR HTH family regulatory protein
MIYQFNSTRDEAAAAIGISPETLRKWEQRGKIPPHVYTRLGDKTVRYCLKLLTDWQIDPDDLQAQARAIDNIPVTGGCEFFKSGKTSTDYQELLDSAQSPISMFDTWFERQEITDVKSAVTLAVQAGKLMGEIYGYADIPSKTGVMTTHAISSREFKSWVTGEFYRDIGEGLTNESMNTVLATIHAIAAHDFPELPVSEQRIAAHDGRYTKHG